MFGEIEKEVVVFVMDSVAIKFNKMLVNSSAGFCDGVFDFVVPFEFHEKDENLEIFAEISRKQVPKSETRSASMSTWHLSIVNSTNQIGFWIRVTKVNCPECNCVTAV